MEWKYTDPRFDVNENALIVILRPAVITVRSQLTTDVEAGTACVGTKHTWCIWTSFDNRRFLDANDQWDEAWCWTFLPKKEVLVESLKETPITNMKEKHIGSTLRSFFEETGELEEVDFLTKKKLLK